MKAGRLLIIPIIASIICAALNCAGAKQGGSGVIEGQYHIEGIEKRYLAEGFISSDIFRVVIVSPKTGGLNNEALLAKAKQRALVSLERSLSAEEIPCDRNTRAEILALVEHNGRLEKADISHNRYEVYYYNVTKKNIKGYLRGKSAAH